MCRNISEYLGMIGINFGIVLNSVGRERGAWSREVFSGDLTCTGDVFSVNLGGRYMSLSSLCMCKIFYKNIFNVLNTHINILMKYFN